MKRKILTCLLCMALAVSALCGCQTGNTSASGETENSAENTDQESAGENDMAAQELTIADITPTELVADMKIGWNLGNTLDATGGMGLDSERSWGNPKTTQEMIDAVLAEGFNVIRIPVTWTNHFGEGPDYTIHESWLDRVQEVVDYAYNQGAYVILNMHHEDWHFPSEENKEAASEILTALWTQISERFKDYDEHLIFEGLNEPRKVGTAYEWNGGDIEGKAVVNHFAQVFVDAVRATGGNNELRHLMITGYAASSNKQTLASIKLPEDDKLIISVHAYTPYNFTLNINGTSIWDKEWDTYDIDYLVKALDELFIQKGIPVIVGEFGAVYKENEEERVEWASYYVSEMNKIGVPCILWDNNIFEGDGEKFGFFNRRELTFPYQDLLNALMEAAE